ncbi:MAG: right-handed parallel beta-helix repeat-containing protein [Candidatus Atribacteria bacterium]|nr:right-handed parallel beta-helix repeat-containing protein [Candidatus Atribacteria bacterium]
MTVYSRFYLIMVVLLMIGAISGCIGDIGQLSGMLSGQPGSTYYVSAEGDNNNSGNRESPWRTPGYASRQLQPGDTLIILGGEYQIDNQEENQIKPASGTPSAWVTIKGEVGNRPIIKGKNNCPALIDLSGRSNIRVENLEFTNDEGSVVQNAIRVVGGVVQNLICKDLYIHHIDGNGILMSDAYGVEIIQSKIEYCGKEAMVGKNFQGDGWNQVTIRDSQFSFSGHYLSSKKSNDEHTFDGLRIGSSVGPIEITNSIFEQNLGNGLYTQAKVNRIIQCIFDNNNENGIVMGGQDGTVMNTLIYGVGGKSSKNSNGSGIIIDEITEEDAKFKIVNVTIDTPPDNQGSPLKVGVSQKTEAGELLFKNNIVVCGAQPVNIGKNISLKASNTLIYRPDGKTVLRFGEKEYSGQELKDLLFIEHFIAENPLFVAPSRGKNGGYYIQENSPARDAGTSDDAPSVDLEGKPRPQGKGYDLGAYEFEEVKK